ncbi:SoxR reducing system RseC family protein [Onishia niordana]|uniref:SoxR reducing system RseC family protein n=1 Tax=Onishia niordana TaxID=2508711 RepID=UPI00109F3156|nr:SoxR reducing system RseC family protein [Halomonas niordiana]
MSMTADVSSAHWLETTARVDELIPDGALISVLTQRGCDGCASRQGCGTGLLATRRARSRQFKVTTSVSLTVGQTVSIGLPSRRFLEGALAVYGLPLLTSLAGGIAAEIWLAPGHPLVPIAFLAGLFGGALCLSLWGRYQASAYRPVLLDPSPT